MTTAHNPSIEVFLKEGRNFPPSKEFQSKANINDPAIYEKATSASESYWADWAKELDWTQPWEKVLEWVPPHAKWFVGGKINACTNCVDRHVFPREGKPSRRNKAAIIWEGEPGDTRTLTYWDLYREVNRFANVLKKNGITKTWYQHKSIVSSRNYQAWHGVFAWCCERFKT